MKNQKEESITVVFESPGEYCLKSNSTCRFKHLKTCIKEESTITIGITVLGRCLGVVDSLFVDCVINRVSTILNCTHRRALEDFLTGWFCTPSNSYTKTSYVTPSYLPPRHHHRSNPHVHLSHGRLSSLSSAITSIANKHTMRGVESRQKHLIPKHENNI